MYFCQAEDRDGGEGEGYSGGNEGEEVGERRDERDGEVAGQGKGGEKAEGSEVRLKE